MAVDKDKINNLVTEAAIELLVIDEEKENEWPMSYNDAISQAFASLQTQAKTLGAYLSWHDFDQDEVWAAIQKHRACR